MINNDLAYVLLLDYSFSRIYLMMTSCISIVFHVSSSLSNTIRFLQVVKQYTFSDTFLSLKN